MQLGPQVGELEPVEQLVLLQLGQQLELGQRELLQLELLQLVLVRSHQIEQ
jgi:hypothetical protein